MAQFMLITVGFEKPSPEDMEKWMNWFQSIGNKMVDQKGLMNGKEISTSNDVKDLPFDLNAQTGYLIIDVENLDEAVNIAKECPAVTSTRVYELRSH